MPEGASDAQEDTFNTLLEMLVNSADESAHRGVYSFQYSIRDAGLKTGPRLGRR